MGYIHEEENDLKNIFSRIRTRNFSGTFGLAMKNSSFQLAQNLIFKIGSLIFTIIVARLLLPDRMGLYSLALSTIVLIASFTDLGIGNALTTYASKLLNQDNPSKAKGYAKKLFKWKISLMTIGSVVALSSAYFLAEFYYNKPIFYALLVGGLYLLIVPLVGFLEQVFKSENNFKIPLYKELVFQISRLVLVPLGILLFISAGFSDKVIVALALLAVVISYAISLIYIGIKTKNKVNFFKFKAHDLNKSETSDLKKFLIPLSATALAGMFFGYIDTFMLGHYVSSEFIAYYGAALALVGGATGIIGFMAASMLPIFSRKSGNSLEKIFKKSKNLVILISAAAAIFTYFVSYYIVRLAYGPEYLEAVPVLKLFSIMVFLIPILGLYVTYYTSQKQTKSLAWIITSSAVLNIVFNIIGITYGLNNFGEMGAVYGATIATIASRLIYLGGLVLFRKKSKFQRDF